MAGKKGFALKFLQWFIRIIQFLCCAVVLALFSYFLATASYHRINIPTWWKAVEGIAGVGVVYTAIGLLLLCCLAGHPATSFIAIVLDIAFVGAFIYVAQANRDGAHTCDGVVNTPFGMGNVNAAPNDLPRYGNLCRMQTAIFAVSIVAILFFLLSAVMEVVLVRNRRKEKAFGPSPANNYTSGYGHEKKRGGLFSRFGRKKHAGAAHNTSTLPEHTHPDQLRTSYATETTAVGHEPVYNKPAHGHVLNGHHDGATAYPEAGVTNGVTNNTANTGYRY